MGHASNKDFKKIKNKNQLSNTCRTGHFTENNFNKFEILGKKGHFTENTKMGKKRMKKKGMFV